MLKKLATLLGEVIKILFISIFIAFYIGFLYPIIVSILIMIVLLLTEPFKLEGFRIILFIIGFGYAAELLMLKSGIFITACLICTLVRARKISKVIDRYKKPIAAVLTLAGVVLSVFLLALNADDHSQPSQSLDDSFSIKAIGLLMAFLGAALITGYSVPLGIISSCLLYDVEDP